MLASGTPLSAPPGSCEQPSEIASLLQRTAEVSAHLDPATAPSGYGHPSWLASCRSIYLDVGSNIGVQVRKLFEPGLYPTAPVLTLFEKHFGSPAERCAPAAVSGICALGIEANPDQQNRLRQIETAYTAKGWHVHFYPVAVAYDDGVVTFQNSAFTGRNGDVDDSAHISTLLEKSSNQVNVTAVDFGAFIKSLPPRSVRLMKMDVEGAEWDSLASMDKHGAMCSEHVEEAFIETHDTASRVPDLQPRHWHDNQTFTAIQALLARQSCSEGTLSISELDDETYADDHNGDNEFGDWSECQSESVDAVS